jgi:phosphoglycerol transferase MdoB-like AlkP superfamily enzyme
MIGEILDNASGPTFVFAITMENHGPLHLEQVAPGDAQALYVEPPPAGFEDLTVYLRHLGNADRMLDGLIKDLRRQPREGVLCWFGDHVPSMPDVYAATGFEDGRTDYLVWRGGADTPSQRDLRVEQLGDVVLAAAGLNGLPVHASPPGQQ